MAKIYSVFTLIGGYGPEIESSYFDHDRAVNHLYELAITIMKKCGMIMYRLLNVMSRMKLMKRLRRYFTQ